MKNIFRKISHLNILQLKYAPIGKFKNSTLEIEIWNGNTWSIWVKVLEVKNLKEVYILISFGMSV